MATSRRSPVIVESFGILYRMSRRDYLAWLKREAAGDRDGKIPGKTIGTVTYNATNINREEAQTMLDIEVKGASGFLEARWMPATTYGEIPKPGAKPRPEAPTEEAWCLKHNRAAGICVRHYGPRIGPRCQRYWGKPPEAP